MASWLLRSSCHGATAAVSRVLTRDSAVASSPLRATRRPRSVMSSQRGLHQTPAAAMMGSSEFKSDEQNRTMLLNQVAQLINSDSSEDPDKDIKLWWAIQAALNHKVPSEEIDRVLTHKNNQVKKDEKEGLAVIPSIPQECEFEGTGPHGISFLVRCLTHNPTEAFERVRVIVEQEQKCKMGIEHPERMHHMTFGTGIGKSMFARGKKLMNKLSWSKSDVVEEEKGKLSELFAQQQGKMLVASPYVVALRACDGDEEEVEDELGLIEQEEMGELMDWIHDTELLDKNTPYAVELSEEKDYSTPKRALVSVEAENFYPLLRALEADGKVIDDARLEYQPKRQTFAVLVGFKKDMKEIDAFVSALHKEEDVVQVVHNGWFED